MRIFVYSMCWVLALTMMPGCGGGKDKEQANATTSNPVSQSNERANDRSEDVEPDWEDEEGFTGADGLRNGLFPQAGAGTYPVVFNSTGMGGGLFPQRGTEDHSPSRSEGSSNTSPSAFGAMLNAVSDVVRGSGGSGVPTMPNMGQPVKQESEYGELYDKAAEYFQSGEGEKALDHVYAYMLSSDDAMSEFPMRWHSTIKRPRVALRWGVGVVRGGVDDERAPVIGEPVADSGDGGGRDNGGRGGGNARGGGGNARGGGVSSPTGGGNARGGGGRGGGGRGGGNARGGGNTRGGGGGAASSTSYAQIDASTPTGLLLYYTGDFGAQLIKEFDKQRQSQGHFGRVLKDMPVVLSPAELAAQANFGNFAGGQDALPGVEPNFGGGRDGGRGDGGRGGFDSRGAGGRGDGGRGGFDSRGAGGPGGAPTRGGAPSRGGADRGGQGDGGRGGFDRRSGIQDGGGRGGAPSRGGEGDGGRGGFDRRSGIQDGGGRGGAPSRGQDEGGRGGLDRGAGIQNGGLGDIRIDAAEGFQQEGGRGGFDRRAGIQEGGRGGQQEGGRGGFDRRAGVQDGGGRGGAPSRGGNQDAITYSEHVQPILQQRCASCHNANKTRGGFDLSNFANLMRGGNGGAAVEPGKANESYLYALVTHSEDPVMPPNGNKIPQNEIDVIRQWIDGGALEGEAVASRGGAGRGGQGDGGRGGFDRRAGIQDGGGRGGAPSRGGAGRGGQEDGGRGGF